MQKLLMDRLADQLSFPTGSVGRVVARLLNHRNRGPITGTIDALGAIEGLVVVDVGFGGGLGLQLLLDRVGDDGQVIGVDPSPTVVGGGRKKFRREISNGKLRLHETAMAELPLDDRSVDAVTTANTIYYIDDFAAALTEVVRVLRPGGWFSLGVGDPDYMAGLPFTGRENVRLRPIPDVVDLMVDAGLRIVDHQRVGSSDRAFHVLLAQPLQVD